MIQKFKLFEKNDEIKTEIIPQPKEEKEEKTQNIKHQEKPINKNQEKKEQLKESIKKYDDFIVEGEGGGAYVSNGSSYGMGNVVAPQTSSTPGDVAGSTEGSGDLPAYNMGTHFGFLDGKKKRKSKKVSKDKRHKGTNVVKHHIKQR